jgi:hypothetical protein
MKLFGCRCKSVMTNNTDSGEIIMDISVEIHSIELEIVRNCEIQCFILY